MQSTLVIDPEYIEVRSLRCCSDANYRQPSERGERCPNAVYPAEVWIAITYPDSLVEDQNLHHAASRAGQKRVNRMLEEGEDQTVLPTQS